MLKNQPFLLQTPSSKFYQNRIRKDSQRRDSIRQSPEYESNKQAEVTELKNTPKLDNLNLNSTRQEQQSEDDLETDEYNLKHMNPEQKLNTPTSIRVIEKDITPRKSQATPMKLALQNEDQDMNTSTIKISMITPHNTSSSQIAKSNSRQKNTSNYNHQDSFTSYCTPKSSNNGGYLQGNQNIHQSTTSVFEKQSSQQLPGQQEGVQNYQQHLKKQETLRTFGQMFKHVPILKLNPEMQERKMTYDIFHLKNYKRNQCDIKSKSISVTERSDSNQQKRGVMYTKELWSDSYYSKVLKSSMLDKIEQQINSDKMHLAAKESQNTLNKYFETLFEGKEEKQQQQQTQQNIYSKRRISLNQNEILTKYINNQISQTNILTSQRQILHQGLNTELSTPPVLKQSSQFNLFSSAQSIQINLKSQQTEQTSSRNIPNQNIFSAITKKSAFSQNNQLQTDNYLLSDNINSCYTKSCINELQQQQHDSHQTSTSQLSLRGDEEEDQEDGEDNNNENILQQQQQPSIRQQIFTFYNQRLTESSFKLPKHAQTKKWFDGSITCRKPTQKSLHSNFKGSFTSRNNSPEMTTKASPFFLSSKNSQINSLQNLLLNKDKTEKFENKIQKQYIQQQPQSQQPTQYLQIHTHRRTFSEQFSLKKSNQQQQQQQQQQSQQKSPKVQDKIVDKFHQQKRSEIGNILKECQTMQNDNVALKDKIKEQIKEQLQESLLQNNFVVGAKKKQYLIALNSKQTDSRETIDQRRKYMNSFKSMKTKDSDAFT